MSKRVLRIIWISLICLAVASLTFLMIFFKMEYWSFMGAMITTMAYGFLNILLMLAWVLKGNEIKRLTAAIYASLVAIGVLGYYVVTYIGHYDEFRLIYWIVYGAITVILVVTLTVINYKIQPQKPVMTRRKS